MKCYECGGETSIQAGHVYHYTESGLDNVYLKNVDVIVCQSCGAEMPMLAQIEVLHAAIGRAIALQPVPLSGKEVRFLRKQIGNKAKEWAALLRIDTATLSRWENDDQQIGPQSDSLIRLLYFRILEEKQGSLITDRITERIAATACDRRDQPTVLLSMDNPAVYSYQPSDFGLDVRHA